MNAISVSASGRNFDVPTLYDINDRVNASATLRIAHSLRMDVTFMRELKQLGIYDDDAAGVIDDEEDLEG